MGNSPQSVSAPRPSGLGLAIQSDSSLPAQHMPAAPKECKEHLKHNVFLSAPAAG